MIRSLFILLSLGLAACADSGVVWNDYSAQPSAVERNRAMMVQNPADLQRARTATGRDGNRAVDVLSKYGRGEATSSAPEALSHGSVSAVGRK
ncbi:MAG TPA: CpaD family pilus assembly lipoprotein [Magnetospirillum sp.]|nr:CpaD family pilus assembly lipoprotein [Magnetospirillum sp.]